MKTAVAEPKQAALAIATSQPVQIQPVLSSDVVPKLLDKAIDGKAAVEVIKELRAMWLDDQTRQAKAAFQAAMALFKAEAPIILKEKAVPDRTGRTAYKYAPLEAVETQIRAIEAKHGFTHHFPAMENDGGKITATCRVTHRDGHCEDTTVTYRLGTKTAIMSDTQQDAAAESFAKRRALTNAYGLTIAGEDLDGATGKLKPAGPSSTRADRRNLEPLARELWNLLTGQGECIKGETNWNSRNRWLWDKGVLDGAVPEEAPHLTEARFIEVITKVKQEIV